MAAKVGGGGVVTYGAGKGGRDVGAKELRKLEKRLAAARKTETKRLRQLAAAQESKGRKEVANVAQAGQ